MAKVIEQTDEPEMVEKMVKDHLNRGIVRKGHPFKNFVLSTTSGTDVDSRLVVLRGKENTPFTLTAYTDIRSGKIEHIKNTSKVSCLFWHPSSKLQVRVSARAKIFTNDKRSRAAWEKTTAFGKTAYNTINIPGAVLSRSQWEEAELRDEMDDRFFAVLDFCVCEMDVLQLSRQGHIRAQFTYSDRGELSTSAFVIP